MEGGLGGDGGERIDAVLCEAPALASRAEEGTLLGATAANIFCRCVATGVLQMPWELCER